jgi:hypothetical protein
MLLITMTLDGRRDCNPIISRTLIFFAAHHHRNRKSPESLHHQAKKARRGVKKSQHCIGDGIRLKNY